MTTLRDVARLAGVSTVTVSRVVNKSRNVKAETRAQVESAMAQLGVVPSEVGYSLGQKRSRANALLTVNVARSSRESAEVVLPLPGGRRKVSPQETSSFPGETARTMLRIVRAAQPISRVDLARRLEVNRSTVTELVTPLIASGVLREAAPAEAAHRRGRPPIGLTLRSNRSLVIGVNIGVRRTQVGAATTNGRMLDEESFDTPSDPDIELKQISSVIGRLRASMPERSLISIGVSVPGPTDAGRRKLLFAPHLGWRDVPVAEALIESEPGANNSRKAVPVIVENDATAAAIYEARRRLRARTPKAQNNFNPGPGGYRNRRRTGIGRGGLSRNRNRSRLARRVRPHDDRRRRRSMRLW